MVETWLLEIAKGIGKMFLNPMLYWALFLVIVAGILRIQKERTQFNTKVKDLFAEWNRTLPFLILNFVILSLIIIGAGVVFSYETILVLNIVVILLSITTRFTLLSAAYSVGITYIILYFLPYVYPSSPYFQETNFQGLAILLGFLLIAEAILLFRVKEDDMFAELEKTNRGKWIGIQHLKKMSVIPMFLLIPVGSIESFVSYWPYVTIGGTTFGLFLLPMCIGFDYRVKSKPPMIAKKTLAKTTLWIGILTLGLAIGSIYLEILSLIAICVAFLLKEWMNYSFRMKEKTGKQFFSNVDEGLQILTILPHSPAERFELIPGEIVIKVNGKRIYNEDDLYGALEKTGSYCKIEVLDLDKEKRVVQGALYEGEHFRLGIIFVMEPYDTMKRNLQKDEGEETAIALE